MGWITEEEAIWLDEVIAWFKEKKPKYQIKPILAGMLKEYLEELPDLPELKINFLKRFKKESEQTWERTHQRQQKLIEALDYE